MCGCPSAAFGFGGGGVFSLGPIRYVPPYQMTGRTRLYFKFIFYLFYLNGGIFIGCCCCTIG